MARTFKGRRIGETYIKCKCVGVTSESGSFSKYIYEPVCGTGNIVVNTPIALNDDIVPMEHLRMKAQVDILTELNYPVEDICRILGAPEYLIEFYLPDGYAGLDHDDIRNELHRLYTRCTELLEQNAKLSKALDSEKADNILFEHRGKELTEENAKLSAALKTEEEANDILSKKLEEAEVEINDLKERYTTLQAMHTGLSEVNDNLTKQLSDLQEKADDLSGEYIRVCKARDEHIKHINALENKIKELEHDKKVTADMYDLTNRTLCEVRAENAKLQERIDVYAIIMRSHIDSSSLKREALELGKWVFTAVGALHHEGKSIEEIADLLEMPATFVMHVLKDF